MRLTLNELQASSHNYARNHDSPARAQATQIAGVVKRSQAIAPSLSSERASVEHFCKDSLCAEEGPSGLARARRLHGIVHINARKCLRDLLEGREGKETFASLNELRKSRFLGDYGAACRQVADGPIREPSGLWTYIDVLRDSKLAARS